VFNISLPDIRRSFRRCTLQTNSQVIQEKYKTKLNMQHETSYPDFVHSHHTWSLLVRCLGCLFRSFVYFYATTKAHTGEGAFSRETKISRYCACGNPGEMPSSLCQDLYCCIEIMNSLQGKGLHKIYTLLCIANIQISLV